MVLLNANSLGMARFTVTTVERKKKKWKWKVSGKRIIVFDILISNRVFIIQTTFAHVLFLRVCTWIVYLYLLYYYIITFCLFLLFEIFYVYHNNIIITEIKSGWCSLNRGKSIFNNTFPIFSERGLWQLCKRS